MTMTKTQLDEDLAERLTAIREQGLYRQLRRIDSPQTPLLRVDGQSLLNFSSNDYLGLANDPSLREAATQAVNDFGVGSGASRLICGSLAPHHELEESLAAFKGTEAALSFSSGYATALGTISALLEKEDVIVLDKRVHACVVDAARLCGAKMRVFAHNDLNELEAILQWADQRRAPIDGSASSTRRPRVLVVTESVFSMDGNLALLREIIELKDRYGAWLMLDEAHATGLFGEKRRGLAEAFELGERVDIQMGTLGKALGSAGGYIAGSRTLIDFLINRARSFIFSTALVPAAAAAATRAVRLIQSPEGEKRRVLLWALVEHLKTVLIRSGAILPPIQSAILPWIIGPEKEAVSKATALREHGIFIPAIRYPTVSRGQARLRLTITAAHKLEHIEQLQNSLASLSRPENAH